MDAKRGEFGSEGDFFALGLGMGLDFLDDLAGEFVRHRFRFLQGVSPVLRLVSACIPRNTLCRLLQSATGCGEECRNL